MTHTQQPEALRLADKYEIEGFLQDPRFAKDHWCRQAAAELRRLHAENQQLHEQMAAIGAGGVEPLRKAAPRIPAPDYDPQDVAFTAAPQTTEDQSRAAFEAYYSDNYEHETAIIRNAEGSYIFPGAAFAWLTWQAAVEWANSRRPGQRT